MGADGIDCSRFGLHSQFSLTSNYQLDALKESVYEMRFDEVSARYGEFGRFFISMKMAPGDLWQHLHL